MVDFGLIVFIPRELKRKKTTEIDCSLWGIDLPVDIIVATPADLVKHSKLIGSVIRVALREGKVIYEKAA